MKVEYSYPGYELISPVEVPRKNLIGVFAPRVVDAGEEEAILSHGFAEPIGAPTLRDAVSSRDRVLVLIDDATRGTPISRLLERVIEELQAAGVRDDQVLLLTAPGTHREMTEAELRQKLGPYYGRFSLRQHRWLDESSLRDFGCTSDGIRVTANRLLAETDFVVGLGAIVPHRVMDFSGGAKIAFPGVAGREVMERCQWEAAQRSSEAVMGVPDNPMRLRIEEAARLVGLHYIANLVSGAERRIVGCFVGDLVEAHRAGCELSRLVNAVELRERADIVLVDSHPADRDFWQSAKGIYSGSMAVRDGGSLILVSPNPEGVADNHPNLMRIGYRPYSEVVRLVGAGEVEDVVGAAILADVAQVMDRMDCILVSLGIPRADAERLGFRYAGSPEQALEMAFDQQARDATIAVLREGGRILPLISESASC